MLTHPEGYLEARERHYQQFFGPLDQKIMHSTDVQPVHIDIYQFAPTDDRPFWTLITSGMSNERQLEPDASGEGTSLRAEIITYAKEPQSWMFSVLKGLAEMPFVDNTFLHWWHTVPNGMPMTVNPSLLTAFFFLPPYYEDVEIGNLELDGDKVDFLWMLPITEAELNYARENGSRELELRLEEAELSHIIDERRKSVL